MLLSSGKSILWLMFPMKSHYIPCFAAMKVLQNKGYNVVACGSEYFQTFLEENGFEFMPLPYLTEYKIKTMRAMLGIGIKSLFDKSFLRGEYRDFLKTILAFQKLITTLKPEMVFLDEDLSSYHFFIDKDIKTFIFNTKLSIRKQSSIAPFTAFYVPQSNNFLNWLYAESYWAKENIKNIKNRLYAKIALLGNDETKHITHYFRKQKLDISKNIQFYNAIYPVVDLNLTTFILCLEGLEYPWKQKPRFEHYLKLKNETPFWKLDSKKLEAYTAVKDKILKLKAEGLHFVYCAMGSLSGGYMGITSPFYDKLTKIFLERLDLVLLISTGSEVSYIALNDRIFYLESVPQIDVLKYADSFVFHGGMGSLSESIDDEVPMLVYPMNKEGDNPGDAARVCYYGLGEKGNFEDNTQQIGKSIDSLVSNHDKYKENIKVFKNKNPYHASQYFLDLLNL